MTNLSVNINKIATLRNARGHNNPDVIQAAKDIERFGAAGITVHPRPDERHIRYADVRELKNIVVGELNIEGNCAEEKFVELVLEVKPHQVTLVPDSIYQLTSNHGWDTVRNEAYLTTMVDIFKKAGIRVSIFVDPEENMIKGAANTGADRIELYTETFAKEFAQGNKIQAVSPFIISARMAEKLGLGVNAGHDLDLQNLPYLSHHIPWMKEVSIGHALICDALYHGLENAVQLYKRCLEPGFNSLVTSGN